MSASVEVLLKLRITSDLMTPGLPVAVAGKASVAGTLRTPPVWIGVGVGAGVASQSELESRSEWARRPG